MMADCWGKAVTLNAVRFATPIDVAGRENQYPNDPPHAELLYQLLGGEVIQKIAGVLSCADYM
jgi:hypothetical protein